MDSHPVRLVIEEALNKLVPKAVGEAAACVLITGTTPGNIQKTIKRHAVTNRSVWMLSFLSVRQRHSLTESPIQLLFLTVLHRL